MLKRLAFLAISLLALAAADTSGGAPAPAAVVQSFDGFSMAVPSGWSSVKPDRDKTKATLLLGAKSWTEAKAMIKVDSGPLLQPSLRAAAELLVKNFGGKILDQPAVLDGETGIHVVTAGRTLLEPQEVILVLHKDKVWLLMGSALGQDVAGPVEQCRASWHWRD
jgi:hypothetical protein